jgi:hypothetical protein
MSVLLLSAGVAMVVAQDQGGKDKQAMEMPPMGPPEEIKEMAHLTGTWTVAGKMRMEPTSEWIDYSGTTEYKWICDGVALMGTFQSQMFGMPFMGTSIETYDREMKQWQTTWIDNWGARQSTYLGTKADGKIVYNGDDVMQGMKFKTRITVSNLADTSFDWMMEHSMDGGATWYVAMQGKYTKKM